MDQDVCVLVWLFLTDDSILNSGWVGFGVEMRGAGVQGGTC